MRQNRGATDGKIDRKLGRVARRERYSLRNGTKTEARPLHFPHSTPKWKWTYFAVVWFSNDHFFNTEAHDNQMDVLRKCGPSFPAVLAKMPLIETLIISNPEACESDYDALVINLRMISTFRLGLAKALKLAPLEHITDLRLLMSCTYN
jgi:hypothetical protein